MTVAGAQAVDAMQSAVQREADAARMGALRDRLRDLGAVATVRQNRGTEIDAACGQLAAGQPVTLGRRRGPADGND